MEFDVESETTARHQRRNWNVKLLVFRTDKARVQVVNDWNPITSRVVCFVREPLRHVLGIWSTGRLRFATKVTSRFFQNVVDLIPRHIRINILNNLSSTVSNYHALYEIDRVPETPRRVGIRLEVKSKVRVFWNENRVFETWKLEHNFVRSFWGVRTSTWYG